MIKRIISIAVLLLAIVQAKAQIPDALIVKELKLSNGLTVWLNEDHSQPKVFGSVVVKAGSKDCPNTGIAHYFEHIMFKGTDKIGTTNYTKEKVWLDSIAAQYDLLAQTKDELQRENIQKHINQLSIKASDYAIPNEFPRLISRYGGSALNASTSYDYTEFHNTFSPQYFEQWAWLNSERLIHPVFRLFQGELETVYEEKNRFSDMIIGPPYEKAFEIFFAGHPYAYSIIGSTENLKNPKLSEMDKFFKQYYVAGNMGLILCGDFNSDSIMPILEKTFGRIVSGEVINHHPQTPTPLQGKEIVKIKVPLPIIKAELVAFRAPTDKDKDANALDLAMALLYNKYGTGLLDSLTSTHQVMLAGAMRGALNDGGAIGFGFVPNLPFGSRKKAGKKVWSQISRLKEGDFSEKTLEALKLEQSRDQQKSLENIDSRAQKMMDVFSQGRTWDDYMMQAESVKRITKADIVRVANKYINDSYVDFVKKYGSYPKDRVSKPNFEPVIPKNTNAESEYAKQLERIPTKGAEPHLVDFKNDVETTPLTPHATLYTKHNPVNDLFSVSVIYHKGKLTDAKLDALESYLQDIGTDSLSKQEYGQALQQIGTTFKTSASNNSFSITMEGPDNNLPAALHLLRHFMDHAKADKESMKTLASTCKVNEKSFGKSAAEVSEAILEKVSYGEQSSFLNRISAADVKKITGEELISLFKALRRNECSIVYSGQLPTADVEETVKKYLPLNEATLPASIVVRTMAPVDKPTLYLYDIPNARQTTINTYQTVLPTTTAEKKTKLKIWGSYFGGAFSSLLWQEIREFRSYAYSAYGYDLQSPIKYADRGSAYITELGTQKDKTLFAVDVLDSLLCDMPLREKNVEAVKQEAINRINNNYPSFRNIGTLVASDKILGYTNDPNTEIVKIIPRLNMNDIISYYKENIQRKPYDLIIIGSIKNLPIHTLQKQWNVIELKKKDIYR
jgi:predicted Zn-dependent peptidase